MIQLELLKKYCKFQNRSQSANAERTFAGGVAKPYRQAEEISWFQSCRELIRVKIILKHVDYVAVEVLSLQPSGRRIEQSWEAELDEAAV